MTLVEFLTLAATIVGWFVVYRAQKSIQEEARQYQKQDRELTVYRVRMEKASDLTRMLIESSNVYYKLASLADVAVKGGEAEEAYFRHQGLELMVELDTVRTELHVTLYDPVYRTLRDLLSEINEEKAIELYGGIKQQGEHARQFNARARDIEWGTDAVQSDLEFMVERGTQLGDDLSDLANLAGDGFAKLDRLLGENGSFKEPKHNLFRRGWEWFLRLALGDKYLPPT